MLRAPASGTALHFLNLSNEGEQTNYRRYQQCLLSLPRKSNRSWSRKPASWSPSATWAQNSAIQKLSITLGAYWIMSKECLMNSPIWKLVSMKGININKKYRFPFCPFFKDIVIFNLSLAVHLIKHKGSSYSKLSWLYQLSCAGFGHIWNWNLTGTNSFHTDAKPVNLQRPLEPNDKTDLCHWQFQNTLS